MRAGVRRVLTGNVKVGPWGGTHALARAAVVAALSDCSGLPVGNAALLAGVAMTLLAIGVTLLPWLWLPRRPLGAGGGRCPLWLSSWSVD